MMRSDAEGIAASADPAIERAELVDGEPGHWTVRLHFREGTGASHRIAAAAEADARLRRHAPVDLAFDVVDAGTGKDGTP